MRYQRKGIEDTVFDGVIKDIKVKNDECYIVRGVYGTFVEGWFNRYFELTRFAFGRLQFELQYLPEDIIIDSKKILKDTLTIGVHIPSGEPLTLDDCVNSFRMAYDKFACFFEKKL